MKSRKFGEHLYTVLAVLVVVMFSSACLQSCKKSVGVSGKIVMAIQASPVTLDPRIANDAEGDKISALICDGLFKRDDNLDIVPNLAESYARESDTAYTFVLRPGLLFTDGTPLTSEDVVYTYKSIIDGNIASPFKAAFDRVKDVTAPAPDTVRIELKEPYAPFLTMLARGIVSKRAAEAKGDAFGKDPVCVGAYRLLRFVPDSVVELAANPSYFGGAPKNSGIEFQIIKDDNIRVLKLMKGDVDIVQNAIPAMLLESVLKNSAIEKQEGTGIVMTYMGFNLTDPILSKQKVREALAYAIDRDEVISHRWKGMAVKANSILAPGNWAYDPNLPQYAYDPAKAQKLLDEAGYKDPDGDGPKKRFELLYKTSTSKDRIDIARMIAHQLEKVGIGVRVEPYEWGTFYRDVSKGNFQIYSLSWVGVVEPDIFYDVFHSSRMPPDGLNRGHYKNAKIDKLVSDGRVTLDQEKRRAIYAEVQKILFDELPFVPLWYEKNVVVYRKGLSGVSLRPDASYRTLIGVEKK